MQGFRALLFSVLGFVLVCVCGCNQKERTNFSHIAFEVQPVVQSRSDPSIPLSGYRTFTVWCNPQSSDPLLERQLLSIARSMLEAKGYRFADEVKDADMVVAIGFDNQYREIYEPPRTIVLPKYIPPQTSTVQGSYTGYAGNNYVWGNSTGTVTTPGQWTSQAYTRPGRVKGFYAPNIVFFAVDPKRLNESSPSSAVIWEGMASGASKVSDLALTGQMLLLNIATRLPSGDGVDAPRGWIGVSGTMLTPDGQQVYPTVLDVQKGSPSEKAGLRQWDLITEIDGKPTANLTFPQARDLLCGPPGEIRHITVRRLTETTKMDVKLVSYRVP